MTGSSLTIHMIEDAQKVSKTFKDVFAPLSLRVSYEM